MGIRLNTYKGITASSNPKNHENIFRFIPGDTDGTLSVKKAERTAYGSGYCTKGDNKGNGAIILWGSTGKTSYSSGPSSASSLTLSVVHSGPSRNN